MASTTEENRTRLDQGGRGGGYFPLLVPILLGSLSFGILSFVLPIYSKRLGASALEIGGMFSIMAATMAVVRPFVGFALDRFGRKAFFVAALAFRAASMAIFAFATDIYWLYAARLVQGFAASLTWIPAFTIASDLAPVEERGRAVGRVEESSARGELLGALAGFGLLALIPLELGWRLLFAGYALLAAGGAWLAGIRVPETRDRGSQPRPVAQSKPSPALLRLMVAVFATGFSSSMVIPLLMVMLQDRFTTDVGVLALAYLPAVIVYAFLPSRLGRLSDRFGRSPLMAIGLVVAGINSVLLPTVPSVAWLGLMWSIEAVGFSMAAPAEEAMVADLTGADTRGTGYGLYSFAGAIGAIFGPLVGGWMYDEVGQGVPFYANGAVLAVVAVWVLVMLPRRPGVGSDV